MPEETIYEPIKQFFAEKNSTLVGKNSTLAGKNSTFEQNRIRLTKQGRRKPIMKCLMKYPWVKLPRNRIPAGKGIMGAWMRLAARAAFRKGEARYCGYNNPVEPGMWVGGIVGLKAILGLRRRDAALDVIRTFASHLTKVPVLIKSGALDERFSLWSAKPAKAVRLRHAPHRKSVESS